MPSFWPCATLSSFGHTQQSFLFCGHLLLFHWKSLLLSWQCQCTRFASLPHSYLYCTCTCFQRQFPKISLVFYPPFSRNFKCFHYGYFLKNILSKIILFTYVYVCVYVSSWTYVHVCVGSVHAWRPKEGIGSLGAQMPGFICRHRDLHPAFHDCAANILNCPTSPAPTLFSFSHCSPYAWGGMHFEAFTTRPRQLAFA